MPPVLKTHKALVPQDNEAHPLGVVVGARVVVVVLRVVVEDAVVMDCVEVKILVVIEEIVKAAVVCAVEAVLCMFVKVAVGIAVVGVLALVASFAVVGA